MPTTLSTRAPRAVVVALAATVLVGLGACSDDDDTSSATDATESTEDSETTEEDTETTEEESEDTTGGDAEGDEVNVTATDYAFEVPDEIAAGTTLTMTNESDVEVHELLAFRLPDEETRSAEELIALPQAELEGLFRGPPAAVLVAPPAQESFAAVGGTLDEPGRYLLFCAIPVGADPDEYLAAAEQSQGGPIDVAGGPPHFVEGMFAEVQVN
ncbi:MAG: hypothetical protein H0V33_02010 [Acidimicrobiia bacterium]|jgi:hypothetical protein|nr:hypothetical protein [Acidimicrobiia bacterium]